MECRTCGLEFKAYFGKPGYLDECTDCAEDVTLLVAEQCSGDDGAVESMTDNPITIKYIKERIKEGKNDDRIK